MLSNPFLDDDEILIEKPKVTNSYQRSTNSSERKNSKNLFVDLEESPKENSPKSSSKICESLIEQLYCSDRKCFENGKHPSKVIICRNLINKGKKKKKKFFFINYVTFVNRKLLK